MITLSNVEELAMSAIDMNDPFMSYDIEFASPVPAAIAMQQAYDIQVSDDIFDYAYSMDEWM